MAKRAIFLIDGFNLYHSLINPTFGGRLVGYKWLDLKKLCVRFLQPKDQLSGIYYFTALCPWDNSKAQRHEIYMQALKNAGVNIIRGKFKEVTKKCRGDCKKFYKTYEEKRTDVSIGVKLITFAFVDKFDIAYIISADSDLIPAIEEVKVFFPDKEIGIIIPFGKNGEELKSLCNIAMKIKEKHLSSSQFDLEITAADNRIIECPIEWR